MKVHYNIIVYGKVQGVGFRYSARSAAERYGINGFVRNNIDGSVYIEIEGEARSCSGFLNWCRNGPDFGRVDNVVVSESEIKDFSDFSIRR